MEQTLALWLLEQTTSPIPAWQLLSKGSPIHLIPSTWPALVSSALAAGTAPVLDWSQEAWLRPDLSAEWEESEVPKSVEVISSAVYSQILRPLVVSGPEIRGWIMFDSQFTHKVIISDYNIRLYIVEAGAVQTDVVHFTSNEPLSSLLGAIYQRYPRFLDCASRLVFYNLKTCWSNERMLYHLSSHAKLKPFVEAISLDSSSLPLLSVLNSVSLLIKVRGKVKSALFRMLSFKPHSPKAAGLRNLGNTCYMNSVLQCFLHLPAVAIYYWKWNKDWDKPLNCALAELVRDVYEQGKGALNAGLVRRVMGKCWQDGTQQDAEEFLLTLLGTLISEEQASVTPLPAPSSPQLSPLLHLQSDLKGSFIAQLFSGFTETVRKCDNCGYEIVREPLSPFLLLRLGLIPSREFTIRLIHWSPTTLDRKITLEVTGELGSDVYYRDLEREIRQKIGGNRVFLGTSGRGIFEGPKELSLQPQENNLIAYSLPDPLPPGQTALFIDISSEIGPVSTRIFLCPGTAAPSAVPTFVARYLLTLSNSFLQEESYFGRGKRDIDEAKISNLALSMHISVEIWVEKQLLKVNLYDCERDLKINTIADLKALCIGEIRLICVILDLSGTIKRAMEHFKPAETAIKSDLGVTLLQLLEYSFRSKPCIDICPNCPQFPLCSHRFVRKFPPVLTFHIARGESAQGQLSKSRFQVHFPSENLDLTSLEASNVVSAPIYDLAGVILHKGAGLASGHYVAFVKQPVSGKWYYCSDENTQVVAETDVLAAGAASVLVYTHK